LMPAEALFHQFNRCRAEENCAQCVETKLYSLIASCFISSGVSEFL
jgi:hypothetical protein